MENRECHMGEVSRIPYINGRKLSQVLRGNRESFFAMDIPRLP